MARKQLWRTATIMKAAAVRSCIAPPPGQESEADLSLEEARRIGDQHGMDRALKSQDVGACTC